jgi:hypothetical protein
MAAPAGSAAKPPQQARTVEIRDARVATAAATTVAAPE